MNTFFSQMTCTKSEGYIGGYYVPAYVPDLPNQETTTASSVSLRRQTADRRSGCNFRGALTVGVL